MSKATKPTTLLDSALEFLVEAFFTYNGKKPRFAMVHAVTAAELVLKERLARIHPNLILRSIDTLDAANKKTVSLDDLPRRLQNLGVTIESDEATLVHQCARWRNQIVHHLPDFDPEQAKVQFPKLLNFIAEFMRRELGTPIENVLDKRWYLTAKNMLDEWKRVMEEAQSRANTEGHVLAEACRECGGDSVLCLRDSNEVYCHLCRTNDYEYYECTRCGRKTLHSFNPYTEEWDCARCAEKIAEKVSAYLGF